MRDAWRFRNRTDKRHTPDVQKGRSKSHIAEDYAHRETVPMCNLGRPFCTSCNSGRHFRASAEGEAVIMNGARALRAERAEARF